MQYPDSKVHGANMWPTWGRLFRHRSKKTELHVTGLCEGNPSGNRWIPLTKGMVARKMFPFDDVIRKMSHSWILLSGYCSLIGWSYPLRNQCHDKNKALLIISSSERFCKLAARYFEWCAYLTGVTTAEILQYVDINIPFEKNEYFYKICKMKCHQLMKRGKLFKSAKNIDLIIEILHIKHLDCAI